jgi:hypothetical protein
MKAIILAMMVLVLGLPIAIGAQSQKSLISQDNVSDPGQIASAAWAGMREGIRQCDYQGALLNMRKLSRCVTSDRDKKMLATASVEFFEEFQTRAIVYTAVLSLEDLYTKDLVETTRFSFYTFGTKNPILLKVKAELTNRSGEVLNLLARAPLLQFERISSSGDGQEAFAYYLIPDQYADLGDVSQWMVYPGKTRSGEFTYCQRIIQSTHDPSEFCDNIFAMLLDNERTGSFSDIYGAGKATLYISLEGQVFPIRGLARSN